MTTQPIPNPNPEPAPVPPDDGNLIAFPGGGGGAGGGTPPRPISQARLTASFPLDQAEALIETHIAQDYIGVKAMTRLTCRYNLKRIIERMTFAGYDSFNAESIAYIAKHTAENYGNRSVTMYAHTVSRFIRWLYNTGRIEHLIGDHIRWRGGKAVPARPPMTQEDYNHIRKMAAGTSFDWLAVIGWHTGMSLIDCCLLKWGDVDMNQCVIRKNREKNTSPFIVPFQPEDDLGMSLLERRKAAPDAGPDDYIEPSIAAKIVPPDSEAKIHGMHGRSSLVSTSFAAFCRSIGIAKYKAFHSFRRSFISALANSNLNTAMASKMSGHSNPAIFAKYVTPDIESLRTGLVEAQVKHLGMAATVSAPPPAGPAADKTWAGVGAVTTAYKLKPSTIYSIRYGFPRLPGSIIVRWVLTGPVTNAGDAEVVVMPCDEVGNRIGDKSIIVHVNKIRKMPTPEKTTSP